ncbi:MAG: EAL domain-containing protein [Gammaproteobacteria bacterium]|nr:EAL domain-containing protein [Gammaproteobacteria bacterium]
MITENMLMNYFTGFPGSFKTMRITDLFLKSDNKPYLKQQLLNAISYDEFELVYQPQIEIMGQRVIGVEALLRWNSPEFGVIFPEYFIPAAEKFNLISELGNLVIDKACKQASLWKKQYSSGIRIAVNVSYMQVHNKQIVDFVGSCISKYDIDKSSLEIELTESCLIKDQAKVIRVLNEFKELGIRTAMDDFGTGYSSLSYLASMPFDMIKIDRSFINLLGVNSANTVITETIIEMSKKLKMEVLAEGVETVKQRNILLTSQCDLIQGNLVCRPVSADRIPAIAGMTLC